MNEKMDLLARIAWDYFILNKTQQEIGDSLNMSRMKIQRFLNEAIKEQVVRISIKHPYANLFSLERELIETFGILDAVVVPGGMESINSLRFSLAKALVDYLEIKWLEKIGILGIGMGKTISYMPQFMDSLSADIKNSSLKIVSIQGILLPNASIHSSDTPHLVAQKLGVEFYGIWAPAMAETVKDAQVMRAQRFVKEAIKMSDAADLRVAGIGTMSANGYFTNLGYMDTKEFDRLNAKNVIGDIMGYFFDKDGHVIDDEINKRVISASINPGRGTTLGIAGGTEKVAAIHATLRGHLIDILVTDEETCKLILERHKKL